MTNIPHKISLDQKKSSKTGKPAKKASSSGFRPFELDASILRGVESLKYSKPTPVQRRAIPLLMQKHDILVLARTGSGKTAAFLLPMLHLLKKHSPVVGIRGLVLSPTRELALQTFRFAKSLGKYSDLKNCLIVGGNSMETQFGDLVKNPDMVISTPGRLLHIITETELELRLLEMIIFDEGDRLFEQGFQQQLIELLKLVPEKCVRALFSATLPRTLADFALIGLRQPLMIQLDTETTISDDLSLTFLFIRQDQRLATLFYLLRKVIRVDQTQKDDVSERNTFINQVAVFVPTKYHVEYLHAIFSSQGWSCSPIHGTMDQEARKEAILEFKHRQSAILVVTDVAARGIDMPALKFVINAYAPLSEKLFIHRVGRTARADRDGSAFTLLEITEMPFFAQLKRVLNRKFSNDTSPENDYFTSKSVCFYGGVPDVSLSECTEQVVSANIKNPELSNMQRLAENAMKQYKKTTTKPSPSDFVQAKDITNEMGHHPVFQREFNASTKDYQTKVSLYRGAGAIFLQKEGLGLQKSEQEKHELQLFDGFTRRVQARVQEKKEKEKEFPKVKENMTLAEKLLHRRGKTINQLSSRKWCEARKETDFFLSYTPTKVCSEINEVRGAQDVFNATFALQPDTAERLQMERKRKVYMWDSKTKKYKQKSHEQATLLSKGMKNEAGKRIQKIRPSQNYNKWCTQNDVKLQEVGERESAHIVSFQRLPYVSDRKFGKKLRGKLLENHKSEQKKRHEQKNAQRRRFLKRH